MRYVCPEPKIIIQGLCDVYDFFDGLMDPTQPSTNHKVLSPDAKAIFEKNIRYVQQGWCSDMPGVPMYAPIGIYKASGLTKYRCLRSQSALEAYHLHLRLAKSPMARTAGMQMGIAREMLFDFNWAIKAMEKAKRMKKHGHMFLWYVDALYDVVAGWLEPGAMPAVLKDWNRVDTTVKPAMFRGVDLNTWAAKKSRSVPACMAI